MSFPRVGRHQTRRCLVASIALALGAAPLATALTAAPAQAAAPYVHVEKAAIERSGDSIVATAHVQWNVDGATDRQEQMIVGDLRVVAVNDKGHQPYLLGYETQDVSRNQSRDVTIPIPATKDAIAAMAAGNRIVLTASQHQQFTRALTDRTYVTVAQIQPFGSPQPRIGTDDCSDRAIIPGANLRYCDLVGAYLDHALVSIHDPDSDEGKGGNESTRLERADLTGATAVRADFSGASIAGGRIDGIDLRNAKLDNLSLAGTEAVRIVARGATSDEDARDSGANFYDTDFTGADLQDTVFRGISFERATLDGAHLDGATWQSIGRGASFRDADLTNADLGASIVDYADFTRADLTSRTPLTDLQLAWVVLCRTTLPAGSQLDRSRDCPGPVETRREPIPLPDQATPFVRIDRDSLSDGTESRSVDASIGWDGDAADPSGYGMSVGDLRLIAVAADTGIPTVLDTLSVDDVSDPTRYQVVIATKCPDSGDDDVRCIDAQGAFASMAHGNRVVLTATQHPPRPRSGKKTTRSYVTVDVLQRGPALGRVGHYDCSRVALTADDTRDLNFCDLSGAMLDRSALNGRFMRLADLTGATFDNSEFTGLSFDGARLAGTEAARALLTNISAFAAFAPRLNVSSATVVGSPLYFGNLDGADFSDSNVSDSPLPAASLRGAVFSGATLVHPDLAFTDLSNAKLDGVDASSSHPSLFLADLTHADVTGSKWNVDETGDVPAKWATLCGTTKSSKVFGFDDDRDCPH